MTAISDAYQTLLDQLLCQWKDSPNIKKLLEILSGPMQDTIDVCEFILDYTDLDDCTGEKLDMWGNLIGMRRPKAQHTDSEVFRMCELGEAGDTDGKTGFYDDTDTVVVGGYFTSLTGIPDQDDPTLLLGDDDYRYMIKQKAKSLRTQMTHTNLFNYLLAFGSRHKVSKANALMVEMQPVDFYGVHALSDYFRHYVREKGLRPAGVGVNFPGNVTKDDL